MSGRSSASGTVTAHNDGTQETDSVANVRGVNKIISGKMSVTDTTTNGSGRPEIVAPPPDAAAVPSSDAAAAARFPSTPLRFFCDIYAKTEARRDAFKENRQRQREEAAAHLSASAALASAPQRDQSPRQHTLPRSVSPRARRRQAGEQAVGPASAQEAADGFRAGPPDPVHAVLQILILVFIIYVVLHVARLA